MKAKAGLKLHNRFDIVKNGEWVGFAENIILDQMYTRLCNFQTYFVNIHFGIGAGTPTPTRTSLFSHLGTKVAVDEEIIKASPTSKYTRKVIINPEEFVGSTITEVGIAFGSTNTNLVTHAMIKDSEGNPLSILKTDIDVIIIYASVFITLVNPNDNFKFSRLPNNNALLNYLCGGTMPAVQIGAGTFDKVDSVYATLFDHITIKNATVLADVLNKKVSYSTTFGISEANRDNQVGELALVNILRITPFGASGFGSNNIVGKNIGAGDGVSNSFLIPHSNAKNLKIYVNGIETTNFVYESDVLPSYKNRLFEMSTDPNIQFLYEPPFIYALDRYSTWHLNLKSNPAGEFIIPINQSLEGYKIGGTIASTNSSGSAGCDLYASNDGITWDLLIPYVYSSGLTFTSFLTDPIVSTKIYSFLKVKFTRHPNYNAAAWDFYFKKPNQENANRVVLTTPPAAGLAVTADYMVEYTPKDADYILNTTFEVQFGEGV